MLERKRIGQIRGGGGEVAKQASRNGKLTAAPRAGSRIERSDAAGTDDTLLRLAGPGSHRLPEERGSLPPRAVVGALLPQGEAEIREMRGGDTDQGL